MINEMGAMFTINEKFLNSEADICLKKAAVGKEFAPSQATLYMVVTFKKEDFSEELHDRLYKALDSFGILEFEVKPHEREKIELAFELGTSLQPDPILSVIELVFEKYKN